MNEKFYTMEKVYLNNKLTLISQGTVNPDDRGFLLGDGVFETIRVYHGNLINFMAHFERLKYGLKQLDIPSFITCLQLKDQINTLLLENKITNDGVVRVTLSRGISQRGISIENENNPTILITARVLNQSQNTPMSLYISKIRRNDKSPLSKIKSLNYLDNILARREAFKEGFDDALLLNTKNKVTGAAVANIFLVKNDEIITPLITDGALPGTMRSVILTLAKQLGYHTNEKSVSRYDLSAANEIFLTNSLKIIQPVIKINNNVVGKGKQGPITKILFDKASEVYHELRDAYSIA